MKILKKSVFTSDEVHSFCVLRCLRDNYSFIEMQITSLKLLFNILILNNIMFS